MTMRQHNGLGFAAPKQILAKIVAAQASVPTIPGVSRPIGYTTTSGFAKRPIYATPTQIIRDPRDMLIYPGTDAIERPDYSGMVAPQIPEQQIYTKEQLLEMLHRGQSETVERSGESDSGLPNATGLEQKSREGDASRQYSIDAQGAAVPVPTETKDNALGWLALAAISFLVLGG